VWPGIDILINDGLIRLVVEEVSEETIQCRVVYGGEVSDHKGVNIPSAKLSVKTVTDKDIEDLHFGLSQGVDMVALSFVREASDIGFVRDIEPHLPVIAKIECPQAVDNLDSIIDAFDGILIARGDLGVELGPHKVPLVQKQAIKTANERCKLCITATEMLESMRYQNRPTRAEASDVANAILDGTDVVMLSGETASGKYPIDAIEMMDRIIQEIESHGITRPDFNFLSTRFGDISSATSHAAVVAADQLKAPLIAVFTYTGKSAQLISDYRPQARIVALSPQPATLRNLGLYWGVEPVLISPCTSTDGALKLVQDYVSKTAGLNPEDPYVIAFGVPVGSGTPLNLVQVRKFQHSQENHG